MGKSAGLMKTNQQQIITQAIEDNGFMRLYVLRLLRFCLKEPLPFRRLCITTNLHQFNRYFSIQDIKSLSTRPQITSHRPSFLSKASLRIRQLASARLLRCCPRVVVLCAVAVVAVRVSSFAPRSSLVSFSESCNDAAHLAEVSKATSDTRPQ